MQVCEMSYLDGDNVIPSLVHLLSSLTEMKFSETASTEFVPATNEMDYLIESDVKEDYYDDSLITNSDPMLNSTNCVNAQDIDIRAWKEKPVEKWAKEDVLFWVYEEAVKVGLFLFNADMPNLCKLTGMDLISMTLEDFLNKMTNDSFARQLYNALQNILKRDSGSNIESEVLMTLRTCQLNDNTNYNDSYYQYTCLDDINSLSVSSNESTVKSDNDSGVDSCSDSEQCIDVQQNFNDEVWNEYEMYGNNVEDTKNSIDLNNSCSNYNNTNHEWSHWSSQSDYINDHHSMTSDADSGLNTINENDNRLSTVLEDKPLDQHQMPAKKRPGRPRGIRKKKPEKIGLLWEFLRDLLHNPEYNPSVICWDDYKIGKFKFVDSERVAKMWGSKRENSMMTFDKFSRAMRYHYRSNTLIAVQKRLVYQFGDKALGWRTPHPILA